MKLRASVVLCSSFCLLAGATFAQTTQIGGGTCSTSTVNGTYAVSINGRQFSSSAVFGSVLQAVGTATFDGQSKVTMNLFADTLQSVASAQTWSGTYTMQANCGGTVSITSGGSATFALLVFSGGSNFLLSGSDGTYAYSGSGDNQPAACSTAALAGVYALNASGFFLSNGQVRAPATAVGLIQFDGQGTVTVNGFAYDSVTQNSQFTYTGSYSVSACSGSITLADANSRPVAMNFSVTNATSAFSSGLDISFARNGAYVMNGAARAAYGQPASAGSPPTAPPPVGNAIGGGNCTASMLNGKYYFTYGGRAISNNTLSGSLQNNGILTFDGVNGVSISGTSNSNMGSGTFTSSGTYTVSPNCSGTLQITTGAPINLAMVVSGGGRQLSVAGQDSNASYAGGASNFAPVACAASSLSGEYTYQTTGFTESGTTINGGGDEAGILQSDGQGKVTASYTIFGNGATPAQVTATGTYTVTAGCQAAATLTDSNGKSNTWTMNLVGGYGQTLDILEANSGFVRTGTGHSAFTNPTQSVANVFSYAVNSTPAGSAFVLFGQNLAAREAGAAIVPFPTTLLNTTVTVNGEPAPLYYVNTGQIDAQMPWDIPGGSVATVIVKNGNNTSNAAAVYVPATGTPGIDVFGNDRAVVVNSDNITVNTGATPAKVGDEVVVYFTGGGPVQAAGKLVSGAPAPSGFSPVTGNYSITVGGVQAHVVYIGLTAGSIGLYQANFIVPQLAKGAYPVIITIDGQASNAPGVSPPGTVNPVMNVN